jgi:hypothetical protein
MSRAALVAPIGERQFIAFRSLATYDPQSRQSNARLLAGKEASMNPTTVALGYLFAGAVIVPAILHFFKTPFDWLDIVLAAVGGAAASLIPTVGGIASYAAMIGILYWRLGKAQLFPDIVVAASVARLALIPLFLLFKTRT